MQIRYRSWPIGLIANVSCGYSQEEEGEEVEEGIGKKEKVVFRHYRTEDGKVGQGEGSSFHIIPYVPRRQMLLMHWLVCFSRIMNASPGVWRIAVRIDDFVRIGL